MENNTIKEDVLRQMIVSLLPLLSKNTLVLFTGGAADAAGLLHTVDSLLATEARIAVSPAFSRIAPKAFLEEIRARRFFDEGELHQFLRSATLTVVPVLTRNTLVKAALGIQDTIVTNAIAATLMSGRPLIGVKENFHPYSAHTREKGYDANPAYNALLLDYEQRLRHLGATLVDGFEFLDTMKHTLYPGVFGVPSVKSPPNPAVRRRFGAGSVVTCSDLAGLPDGATVEIVANAVITPLAQEQFRQGRLILVRNSESKEVLCSE